MIFDTATIAQVLVGGLLLGGVYALAAVGLNLIFGVMRVINVAHGEFLMLGAYVAYFLWAALRINPLVALPVAMLVTFLLGLLVMRVTVERVIGGPDLMSLLVTYGLAVFIMGLSLYFFQGVFRSVPAWSGSIPVAGLSISLARGIAFAAAVVLSLAVWLFLRNTAAGKAVRATAQQAEVAVACGIDVRRVRLFTFGLGTALAGAAGALLISFLSVTPSVGATFIGRAFAICVLGGLGSFPGALIGGLMLGVAESTAALVTTTQLAEAVSYLVLMGVLLVRPQGLMGQRE